METVQFARQANWSDDGTRLFEHLMHWYSCWLKSRSIWQSLIRAERHYWFQEFREYPLLHYSHFVEFTLQTEQLSPHDALLGFWHKLRVELYVCWVFKQTKQAPEASQSLQSLEQA